MSRSLLDFFDDMPARERSVGAGQYLFHRDEPAIRIYWITKGIVHLQRFTSDGSAAVMQRATAGSLLAEASIFGRNYHCDALAVEPVRARQFNMRDVRGALASDAGFAAALAEHLAREVMRMRSRSELASLRTVAARLDAWLALHDNALPPTGKRIALARELGISPEALYRELARRRSNAADRVL